MKITLLILFSLLARPWHAQQSDSIKKDTCSILVPNMVAMNCRGDETFRVKPLCPVSNFTIQIFDRWGTKLFQQDTLEGSNAINWDFLKSPAGVFIWMIKYRITGDTAKKEIKGTVTHIR